MDEKKHVKDTFEALLLKGRFIIILAILNLLLIFLIFRAVIALNISEHERRAIIDKVKEMAVENQTIQDRNTMLQASLTYYKNKSLYQPPLSSKEIAELKKKGLKNPVMDIKADLMKHNEFIPYKGVMGGVMRFASERDIYVVSTRWVRAYFEDGHIAGWMMLEYQVSSKGKIFWKVINSYLDNSLND